ncbi:Eisosome component PIL1-domain-containing protein [Chiua virens]|nr:Eisosome component PIL1-domain-containing protein [Chiua virens]
MSVSGFFTSMADKAQNAINQTPLAGRIPGTTVPAGDHAPDHAPSHGHHRSFALESLQHQIRNIGQQYTSTNPVQRIITLEKGVALDLDALSRDGQAQSKELYMWGQNEDPDLTDVTDRLAFLNYVHGTLSASLAVKLDNARSSLKALRDAETAIAPKRNIRATLRNQIGRLEHNAEKGNEARLTELREQLARTERNDEHLEKEIELLKRKAVRESEQQKWEAIHEYAEKLILVAQASNAQVTAAAKGSLQHALDNYKPGNVNLNLQTGADLARSDTRSFGESHASELSVSGRYRFTPKRGTTIPAPAVSGVTAAASVVSSVSGPATVGGRADSSSEDLYATSPAKIESAEEEKKRLEREERERVQATNNESQSQAKPETAEEEKKRLEREERERVATGGVDATKDGDELPPYQDIQE